MRVSGMILALGGGAMLSLATADAAQAQQYCRDRSGNLVAMTLLGAAAGSALGYGIAGRGSRTEGAVLGGLIGGGLGAAASGSTRDCSYYGYQPSYGYSQPAYGYQPSYGYGRQPAYYGGGYGQPYYGYSQSYYGQPYYSGGYAAGGAYGGATWVSYPAGGRYVAPYYSRQVTYSSYYPYGGYSYSYGQPGYSYSYTTSPAYSYGYPYYNYTYPYYGSGANISFSYSNTNYRGYDRRYRNPRGRR